MLKIKFPKILFIMFSAGGENNAEVKPFHPILPTKEIPRTPLFGFKNGDFLPGNKNLNFTYEFSPLKSNASTPYSENRSAPLNATYVVPVVPLVPPISDLSAGSDSVFSPGIKNPETVNATFPVQLATAADTIREPEDSPEVPEAKKSDHRQKHSEPDSKPDECEANEGPFNLTMDEEKINKKRKGFRIQSADSPPVEAPTTHNRKGRKGKEANPAPEAKKPRAKGRKEKPSAEDLAEQEESEPVPEAAVLAEVMEQDKTDPPVPEAKKTRGRGQKQSAEEQVQEQEKTLPEVKKPRGKGQKPAPEGEKLEEQEKSVPVTKKLRGRGQKQSAEEQVQEQEKAVPEVKKPRGKGQKPAAEDEKQVLEHESADPTSQVPEQTEEPVPVEKKQRAKGPKPKTEEEKQVADEVKGDPTVSETKKSEVRKVEDQAKDEPPAPEARKQRERAVKGQSAGQDHLETVEAKINVPEPKVQRGKGAKGKQKPAQEQPVLKQSTEAESAAVVDKNNSTGEDPKNEEKPVDAVVPETKKRGRGAKAAQTKELVEQPAKADPVPENLQQESKETEEIASPEKQVEVKSIVSEAKKTRGRGAKANPVPEAEVPQVSMSAPSKGKKETPATGEDDKSAKSLKAVAETTKQRGRGAKGNQKTETSVPESQKQTDKQKEADQKTQSRTDDVESSSEVPKPHVTGRREKLKAGQIEDLLEQSADDSAVPEPPKQRARHQRGKASGQRQESLERSQDSESVEEPRSSVRTTEASESVPEAKKHRGKNKQDSTTPSGVPDPLEEAVPEQKRGKGRSRKENPTLAKNTDAEPSKDETPVPEPKKQRGTSKKDDSSAAESGESVNQPAPKLPEAKKGKAPAKSAATARLDAMEQSKSVPETADNKKGGRGKVRKESPTADETPSLPEESSATVPETKKPRGRGRKVNPTVDEVSQDQIEEEESVPAAEEKKLRGRGLQGKAEDLEKTNPAVPPSDSKKAKGRSRRVDTAVAEEQEAQTEVDAHSPAPAETKSGRGRKKNVPGAKNANSAGPESKKMKTGEDSAKKLREEGRNDDPVPEEHLSTSKKLRGRGKPVEAAESEPEATPLVTGKKGRGAKDTPNESAKSEETSTARKTAAQDKKKADPPSGMRKPVNLPDTTPEFVEIINGKASTSQTPAKVAPSGKRVQLFRNSTRKPAGGSTEDEPAPKRLRGKKAKDQ